MEQSDRARPQGHFVGLCTLDLEYVVPAFPLPNRKTAANSQEIMAGGPATNAAVTFSFLGGDASLTSALGCHPLADLVRSDLQRYSVCLNDAAPRHAKPPAISSIFVHAKTGERTAVSANAAVYLGIQEYDFAVSTFSAADILLVDGHHMSLCIEAARMAHAQGITVVLDGGSWKAGLADLVPFVDVAICSDDFAPPEESQGNTISYLKNCGISKVAVTRGAKSILWSCLLGEGELTVRAVQPKDTLGAGDVFHGAFCWACVSGKEFPDALQFAAAVATEKCLHFGTRSWMGSFESDRHLRNLKETVD